MTIYINISPQYSAILLYEIRLEGSQIQILFEFFIHKEQLIDNWNLFIISLKIFNRIKMSKLLPILFQVSQKQKNEDHYESVNYQKRQCVTIFLRDPSAASAMGV